MIRSMIASSGLRERLRKVTLQVIRPNWLMTLSSVARCTYFGCDKFSSCFNIAKNVGFQS